MNHPFNAKYFDYIATPAGRVRKTRARNVASYLSVQGLDFLCRPADGFQGVLDRFHQHFLPHQRNASHHNTINTIRKPQISHLNSDLTLMNAENNKPHWEMNLLIHDPMMLLHLCDHPGKHALPHLNTELISVYITINDKVYLVLMHNNIEQIYLCLHIRFPFLLCMQKKVY